MSIRFTRARKVSVNANYGTHILEYVIPNNKHFIVTELFASTTKDGVIIELQYSDDGGTNWKNPWDEEGASEHLLWILIAAGVPAFARPGGTWFSGDGVNTKLRIKLTNTHPTDNATVFYLVKALEKDI